MANYVTVMNKTYSEQIQGRRSIINIRSQSLLPFLVSQPAPNLLRVYLFDWISVAYLQVLIAMWFREYSPKNPNDEYCFCFWRLQRILGQNIDAKSTICTRSPLLYDYDVHECQQYWSRALRCMIVEIRQSIWVTLCLLSGSPHIHRLARIMICIS